MNLSQFAGYTPEKLIVQESRSFKHRTDKGFFVDALSGIYNVPLGHCREDLTEVARAAFALSNNHNFNIYPGLEMTSEAQMELTSELLNRVPFMESVFYTNSGSEAVDAALRMCRLGKRKTTLSFGRSYHGSTDLAFKASGNLGGPYPNHLLFPYFDSDCTETKAEYLTRFAEFVSLYKSVLSAVIMEPCIGASGGLFMKENILPELIEITHSVGAKFILDEVITGFWRLGTQFAWQKYNAEPDMIILSKAITNGMWPLSVVLARGAYTPPNFGFTTAGHPVGCAIALKCLELLDQHGPQVEDLGTGYDRMFGYPGALPPGVTYTREGLFVALQIHMPNGGRYPRHFNTGAAIAKAAFERGLIVRGNPLSIIMAPMFLDYVDGHSPHAVTACWAKEACVEVLNEHV